jgi:hypothetical protein
VGVVKRRIILGRHFSFANTIPDANPFAKIVFVFWSQQSLNIKASLGSGTALMAVITIVRQEFCDLRKCLLFATTPRVLGNTNGIANQDTSQGNQAMN